MIQIRNYFIWLVLYIHRLNCHSVIYLHIWINVFKLVHHILKKTHLCAIYIMHRHASKVMQLDVHVCLNLYIFANCRKYMDCCAHIIEETLKMQHMYFWNDRVLHLSLCSFVGLPGDCIQCGPIFITALPFVPFLLVQSGWSNTRTAGSKKSSTDLLMCYQNRLSFTICEYLDICPDVCLTVGKQRTVCMFAKVHWTEWAVL